MTISKDQSIITQVAAKIAADLTPKTDDVNRNIADFLIAFEATTDALLEVHGMTKGAAAPAWAQEAAEQQFVETVQRVFPTATVVDSAPATGGFQVRVKGQQHGPLPEWLHTECAKKGVTEVWDNRNKLSENPKRPWFKAVNGTEAFWAPRGK